jgi:hypothetical protein
MVGVKGHRQFFSVLAAHRPWLGSQQMGIWLQISTLQRQRIIYLVVSSSSVLLHLLQSMLKHDQDLTQA